MPYLGTRRAPNHPLRLFEDLNLGPEGPQTMLHDCLEASFWGPICPKPHSTTVWRHHFGARRAPNHPLRLFGGRILGPERPQTPSTIVWRTYFVARRAPNILYDCLGASFWGTHGPKHPLRLFGGLILGPAGTKPPSTTVWGPHFGYQ